MMRVLIVCLLMLVANGVKVRWEGEEDGNPPEPSQDTQVDEAKVAAKAEEQKFAEVVLLMNKYDQAEQRVKWINSPEYAKQQEV